MRLVVIWVIAMSMGVSLTACGSAGSNAESSPSPLTKAQFVQRTNAICLENTGEILEPIQQYMSSHAGSGQSEAELTADAVREEVLPGFEKQVEEIGALSPPKGDEQRVEEFLQAMQQGIDSLSQSSKIEIFTDIDEAFTAAKTRAEAYGLTECL